MRTTRRATCHPLPSSRGIFALVKLSPTLASLVGKPTATRPEVTKALWAHIKSHGLQDVTVKTQINLDATLKGLFSSSASSIPQTQLLKLVQPHLTKLE